MPLVVDELLVGAALGAIAEKLLDAILAAKDKIRDFKSDMERLQFTLQFIIPKIGEIEVLDGELNYPESSDINRLKVELEKGMVLVSKCSTVKNSIKKVRYSAKLKKLNDYLERFFSLNVNVEFWSKRVLVKLQEVRGKFDQLNSIEKSVESGNVDQKQVLENLQEVRGKLDLIETSVGSGNVDQKRVLDNLQELSGKLDQLHLIERSVGSGNIDLKRVLDNLQELSGKFDRLNLIGTSDGSGNMDQKQTLFELQEANRKLDLIEESVGGGNVDQKQTLFELQEANRKLDLINRRLGSGNVDQNECQCAVPEIPNFSVGLDVRVKELKMVLFKDNVSMIGLCALGGSGKTTLASKFCQDEQVKEIFKDNIIFLTVSSSPNFKVIVGGIFRRLHVESQFLNFQNDEDAEKQLRYLMKQKEGEPILLVLDDVWDEQFLKKFVFRTVGHKILVTSRTKHKQFDSTYSLEMLSDSDSLSLFCHLAFPQNGNYEMPDEECVKKIVQRCKGLSLTLTVIASSLCGEPTRMWRRIERKLGEGYSIFNAHKDLLECLATSLEFLDDDVRECFLDLGLFPKGQWISASVLVDIWVGLYELDEDDAYFNLRVLFSRNLVDLVVREDAGESNFDDLFVTQHDVLRDLAIYKCSEQQNINQRKRLTMDLTEDGIPKSLRDQDDLTFHASLVSIRTVFSSTWSYEGYYTDKMFSSTWSEMQFPKVEVLILSISTCKFTLPKFIEKMSKLKVLIILNKCYSAEPSGLSSLGYLSQLKILRLHGIGCPNINDIRGLLKNLQKVSLDHCDKCFYRHFLLG